MSTQETVDSRSSEGTPYTPERASLKQIFVLLLAGASIAVGTWAAVARFDQTILASGKLELQGAASEIKAPSDGVMQEVYVRNGDVVQVNQLLASFKPAAPEANLTLKKEKEVLTREIQFLEEALKGGNPAGKSASASLVQLRGRLVRENQYYQMVTDKNLEGAVRAESDADQQRFLAAGSPELQARASAIRLEIQESEQQLSQVQEKLAAAQNRLRANQTLLRKLTNLAVPDQHYQRQTREVLSSQAELDQLKGEQQRVTGAIIKAREELQNIIVLSATNVLTKLKENQTQLAQIESQLRQTQVEKQKRSVEIDAELSKAEQALQPQQLKSSIAGIVSNLQPLASGAVVRANQNLLTIVPNGNFIASVFLKDQDVRLLKDGMVEDLRIACSPANGLGRVEGELVSVGPNALAPVPERPYYLIPARIQLKNPSFDDGKQANLQPRSGVNCSLKLPQKKTVLDVVRDKFDRNLKTAVELIR